jgi:hypothetical protein
LVSLRALYAPPLNSAVDQPFEIAIVDFAPRMIATRTRVSSFADHSRYTKWGPLPRLAGTQAAWVLQTLVSIVLTIERRVMPLGLSSFCRRAVCALGALVVGSLLVATPASAGPIAIDTYYEFAFGDVGDPATGCDPADPAGPFCIPSSGTPTEFLNAAPWTFNSTAIGSTLSVTDSFLAGDRFEIFDFGVSIGFTSPFVAGTDCSDDPVPCLADPGISHGVFALASGAHSISIVLAEGGPGGSGYLLLEDGGGPTAVPEPATLVLLTTGAGMAYYRRRRQS